MKRRLFLTGPIGCGKSTAIREALADKLPQCDGFLTRRYREPHLHFTLESPDGCEKETFLDFAGGKPELRPEAFSGLGTQLLQPPAGIAPYVLDEIGGMELLNPDFSAALDALLNTDVPILGVIKGEGPAGRLVETLGLTEVYTQALQALRQRLLSDPHTLVYECKEYDEHALRLARQWAEEYCHE